MLPHKFCAGCGHIPISKIVEKELIERRAIFTGSVGCSVALPDLYEVIDAVSSAHGRALSVATALHRVLPDIPILTYQGDGDACTIGIGELIHTILRNENIVCVMINNSVFGMTGFQMSSTTPIGTKTKTTVAGRNEFDHGIPLDIKLLMKQNKKTKYYLTHSANRDGIDLFEKQLKEAFDYDGFSLIEVISPCVTLFANAKKAYKYALEQYTSRVEQPKCDCMCGLPKGE